MALMTIKISVEGLLNLRHPNSSSAGVSSTIALHQPRYIVNTIYHGLENHSQYDNRVNRYRNIIV